VSNRQAFEDAIIWNHKLVKVGLVEIAGIRFATGKTDCVFIAEKDEAKGI
jgi:hypothetical protein